MGKKIPKPDAVPSDAPDWEAEATANLANWHRAEAEIDNLKKRAVKEKQESMEYAKRQLILDLLPVVDNFDRALEHVPTDQAASGWLTGITYIQKQLLDVFRQYQVEKVDVKAGDPFDHHTMHAVEQKADETVPGDHIIAIISSPYKMGEELIRPGAVIVSAGATTEK